MGQVCLLKGIPQEVCLKYRIPNLTLLQYGTLGTCIFNERHRFLSGKCEEHFNKREARATGPFQHGCYS